MRYQVNKYIARGGGGEHVANVVCHLLTAVTHSPPDPQHRLQEKRAERTCQPQILYLNYVSHIHVLSFNNYIFNLLQPQDAYQRKIRTFSTRI